MINWLLQTTSDHPDLARGIAPAGLLSDAEQVRLAALKTGKRRRDWLLGRWTAKRLIQPYVERQTGSRLPLDALIIGTDPDGAPHVIADYRLQIGSIVCNLQSIICNLRLSISHSGDRAFCALSDAMGAHVGADIERIEPRSWQFVEDYFTDEEIELVRRAPADRDTLVTAIWSAKEAVLKALHLGLTVDTRSVSCSIAWPDRADGWANLALVFDGHLLELDTTPALVGWWRRMDDFVLTVAVTHSGRRGFEGIDDSTNRTETTHYMSSCCDHGAKGDP
jgi:4'-phosphopantetheinyl transferase